MRGFRTTKYTLFFCCYIFWVSSSVLIAVGVYAKIAKEKDVVDTLTVDPALLLILIGLSMFILTFFGCVGALRNAPCLLKTFLGILAVIVLLQIAAAVLGFTFSDRVILRTEMLMMKAIVRYREDLDLENAIDFIQKKFQCCGVQAFTDWSHNVYFNCSDSNPSLEACGVPFSCCHRHNQSVLDTMCGHAVQLLPAPSASSSVSTSGCLEQILRWSSHNLMLVGGLGGAVLLLEVCMISLAALQVSRIQKVLRQRNQRASPGGRRQSLWYPAVNPFPDE